MTIDILTNVDEQGHHRPISIWNLTQKLSSNVTSVLTVETNMPRLSVSVVAICSSSLVWYHTTITRKVKLPITCFRRNVSTTSGAVSGSLQSSIFLSNVSPQHSGAIGIGNSIEVKSKCSTYI